MLSRMPNLTQSPAATLSGGAELGSYYRVFMIPSQVIPCLILSQGIPCLMSFHPYHATILG